MVGYENYQFPAMRRNVHPDEAARTARALAVWRETRPAAGTVVETYLANRGLALPSLALLRFHPAYPHPSGSRYPAIVALVEHCQRGPVGVHRTYLHSDRSGKASIEPAKASRGSVGGGAVRFGMKPWPEESCPMKSLCYTKNFSLEEVSWLIILSFTFDVLWHKTSLVQP
jgi:hypothetical protein